MADVELNKGLDNDRPGETGEGDSKIAEPGHGCDGGGCIHHRSAAEAVYGVPAGDEAAMMPHSFKGWKAAETGDADDTVREGEPESPIDRMARQLADFFAEQAKLIEDMLGRTRSGGARKKAISQRDIDRMAERLRAMTEPLAAGLKDSLADMLQTGGEAGLERLGLDTVDPFSVFNPKVTEFLNDYTVRLAGRVNDYTIERMQATLTEGMQDGETISELSARVQRETDFNKTRATNIARTESARAYVEGEQLAWKESGVVEGKQWLLAPEPCPFCAKVAAEFNEKTIPLDQPFYKRGAELDATDPKGNPITMRMDYSDVTGPPLHPQCRCDVLPVLRELPE